MKLFQLSFYIAQRLQSSKHYKHSVSARIIKIATVAVALGICMILVALATGFGLQREIESKTAVFNGHLTLSTFENNSSSVSLRPIVLEETMEASIETLSDVLHLEGVTYKAGLFKSKTTFEGAVFKGVDANYPWDILKDYMREGRFPNTANQQREVLLSQTIANRLAVQIGDRISIFFQNKATQKIPIQRTVEVVGLYQSGFPEFDESLIFGSKSLVNGVNKWTKDQVGSYEVILKDYKTLSQTADTIYEAVPSDLDVIAVTDRYANIFQWIALFDYNILIILVIMIVVGVINMATALLVMILERSRMIGLLQTLGASNRLIQMIFLWNGAKIFLRGLLWGNLLGLVFYFSQYYGEWIRLDPKTYFVQVAPVFLSVPQIILLNLFVVGVSLFFLWFPVQIVIRYQARKKNNGLMGAFSFSSNLF
ncbi:MAG: ABC transporter permease [Flavobacteriaceae bacterium]